MVKNDYELIDIVTGYQPAAVVTAGLETGVFDALENGPASLGALARSLRADEGALHALLESLVRLGMLRDESGRYSNTSYVSGRIAGGGPMASVIRKEALFSAAWQELSEVVKTGRPVMQPWSDRVSSDPKTARSFLDALDVLARATGPYLARLSELAPNKTVVDVGGGLGTYSAQLAMAGSRAILVDLPAVLEWAADVVGGIAGVTTQAADVFEHPSVGVEQESVDAVLVSHLLHDLKPNQGVELLRRARRATKPGGHVVVNDFAGDSGPGAFGPLFDLMMRVETGGAAHSLADLKDMIEEAGLIDVQRADFDEPLTVLVAQNPRGG